MLLRLIRWFRGYIIFALSGRYPERFINILNKSGTIYWDLLSSGNNYRGKMILFDYRNIRPKAGKAEVRLKIEKRVGFPFYLKKYSARKGVFFGFVIAVIIMFVLSGFVWDIKLNGAETINSSSLMSALDECGLKAGASKASLDFEKIERKLIYKVPEIRWISINALNCIAKVEIKEEYKKPKSKANKKYPCNLVADCDGIITKPIVTSGTCEVKKGSAVMENQLLVSCVVAGTNEAENKLSYVHADGKIFADVQVEKEYIIPKTNNNIILNSSYVEKSNLSFLWLTLPFSLTSTPCDLKSEVFSENRLFINDVTLPIGFDSSRIYSFIPESVKYNSCRAKILLKKNAALYERFNYGQYRIKSKNYSFKELNNCYKLKAVYTINRDIAKKRRVKVLKKVENSR